MPIMEISIVPVGTSTASVSSYVRDAVKILKDEKNIKHELTSMGTIIEADSVEELLSLANKMHNIILKGDVQRVVTSIKIDDRRDKKLKMEEKIKSVNLKLMEE